MSMDSRIANKDKTILSLQLEELEPVFMGKIAKTWSFSKVFFGRVCNPLFMVLCFGVLYPYLLAFVANIYFNADTHIIVLHPHTYIIIVVIRKLTLFYTLLLIALFRLQSSPIFVLQEYSLWRCAPRYLQWASFAMRTRTSGIVNVRMRYKNSDPRQASIGVNISNNVIGSNVSSVII